jgi:hypothetical protein
MHRWKKWCYFLNGVYTVKKASVTQAHHMWALENSVIYIGRAAQSVWMTDFFDLSRWMTDFSVTRMLCSSVTLGFCNRVERNKTSFFGPLYNLSPISNRQSVFTTWGFNKHGVFGLKIPPLILTDLFRTLICLKLSGAEDGIDTTSLAYLYHRYMMNRLSIQLFYLWRHVLSTAPPFILWWSNLEMLFAPLHRSSPFIGGCQAIQTEHGPYIAERTQKAVFIIIQYLL